ncbi:MAG: thioredoxin fold domain-containing protein [Candidatus Marinimicrobia bacterium]|nr:thioredoxin fold domain-containing protein [Candidatus Neomarinimicrobiota bacterium]
MTTTEYIYDSSEATFENDVIRRSEETPVVVDFWAPWCGPCRVLGPTLERLANESDGAFYLAKVNVDENPQLSLRFGVQGIPAVKAFRDGKVVSEFVGAQPEPRVREFLKEIAPTEADQAVEDAASMLATRHWAEAEERYRVVLDSQPGSYACVQATISLSDYDQPEATAFMNPFAFDTGEPMSLGLASIYGILRNHEGNLDVSVDHAQLALRLYFPLQR